MVPLKEHEPTGDEEGVEQLWHQDVLAARPLFLHSPNVRVNCGLVFFVKKRFYSSMQLWHNKLERLSLESFSGLKVR